MGACWLVEQPRIVNFCQELPKEASEGLPSAVVSKPQLLHRLNMDTLLRREGASDKAKQLREAATKARAA